MNSVRMNDEKDGAISLTTFILCACLSDQNIM